MAKSGDEKEVLRAFDVSAVIVNYNGGTMLADCLHALEQARGALTVETIVVDNASTDGSLELVCGDIRASRILRAEKNLGFGRAGNAGAKLARGRYLLFLNTDCFVTPGVLERLVASMEAAPTVAVAGPRLLNPDGTLQPSCHNFPNPLVLLLEQTSLWKCFRHLRFVRDRLYIASKHDSPAEVDWLMGACLMVRREAYAQDGGFDERYFFYWEEADLCRRLRSDGWTVMFEPSAEAVHIGGGSSTDPLLLLRFFKGLYLFYRAHYNRAMLPLATAIVRSMAIFKAIRAVVVLAFAARRADRRAVAASEVRGWLAVARL